MFLAIVGLVMGQILPSLNKATSISALPKPTKVVLTVNGSSIKASEIQALLWDWRRDEVIDDLVAYILFAKEAERVKVTVSDVEVNAKVQQRIAQAGINQQMLSAQGYPPSRIFLRSKVEMLAEKIARKELNPSEYVHLRLLLIRPTKDDAASWEEASKKATEAYARLKAGEAWPTIYQAYSGKDALSAVQGDLGWRRWDEFTVEAQKRVKPIGKGSVTEPIKVPLGYQIFGVVARSEAATPAELKELEDNVLQNKIGALAERLRASAKIVKSN